MHSIKSKQFYILKEISKEKNTTQRKIASELKISLGSVNKILQDLIKNKMVIYKDKYLLTDKGKDFIDRYKVDKAIILAAGFGSRFVPLTYDTPKGLLEVMGEPMLERQIKQLQEVGIFDITVIVGYLKECFEYLIDKYGVKLLFNPEYNKKNTLATLYHARDILSNSNSYILSSDNWIKNNIFNTYELYPWYSCVYSDGYTKEWCIDFDKNNAIKDVHIGGENSYFMYGPVYFDKDFANEFLPYIKKYYKLEYTNEYYWEDILIKCLHDKNCKVPPIYINKQDATNVYEFENIDELRLFDKSYNNIKNNEALNTISKVFNIEQKNIKNFNILKSGMTNKSFIFNIDSSSYICRIPGAGTDKIIDRKKEFAVYNAIKPLNICEEIIYFDKYSGYKISKFYEDARNSDFNNIKDKKTCMKLLKKLHTTDINVDFEFDLIKEIDFYEKLCLNIAPIPFKDYFQVKEKNLEAYNKLNLSKRKKCLAHIDSVSDNFLIFNKGNAKLIDWEYSAMADPIIDIAMSSIYSFFNKEECDELLSIYMEGTPTNEDFKIYYTYISLSGLLWSLWGVYKSLLCEDFGDYTLKMYRYAKDFIKYVNKL